jgi:glucosamine--fructose-6-phosphate aminotransferase (isomerizing)
MCGVIGLIYERPRSDLGRIAAELLETLEYRGYDSTGAAIQDQGTEITLVKGVGAPSVMVHELGVVKQAGQIFCGQVRWATFGAVDELNAQPHEVRCKTHLYGAHNGNVTNCDDLKLWLTSEGHSVKSDNDGEMVVHTIEHFFAIELARDPDAAHDRAARHACMRRAIVTAGARTIGSFAAVIVDPVTRAVWAIKAGSSLYFGLGRDEAGGDFGIASSDLSSVLKLTRALVPMAEGEFIEFEPGRHQLYALRDGKGRKAGDAIERAPVRSRLRAKDTALVPPYETFMEQEIASQEQTCRDVITAFLGGSAASKVLRPFIEALSAEELAAIRVHLDQLRDEYDDARIAAAFRALVDAAAFRGLLHGLPEDVKARGVDRPRAEIVERLVSSDAGFFTDLLAMGGDRDDAMAVRLLDVLVEKEELAEYQAGIEGFVSRCRAADRAGARVFVICCGSSFHAAMAASVFFHEVARFELVPVLPGEFRGRYGSALRDGDVVVAVSQSGETKDLIDVLKDVIASGRAVQRFGIVNNVNSTIGQELCEQVLPLRCGPEIAVPATKSFMNQMAVFYCLALRLAERRLAEGDLEGPAAEALKAALSARLERLPRLPALIRETVEATRAGVEEAGRMMFLAPSLHILATRTTAVAKEGALKIREVVLNHTEGFEGSEFKHGPNTILGLNTLYGPRQVEALLERLGGAIDGLLAGLESDGVALTAARPMVRAAMASVFAPGAATLALGETDGDRVSQAVDRDAVLAGLYADYPLIFVTGPDERDVHLTISQINTHKIRGTTTVVLAEEHPGLRQAALKPPGGAEAYRAVFVPLPRTDDTLMTMFSATVVLQRLALVMSQAKAAHLDRLGVKEHGVHPDVPKNVSKSITVD